MTEQPPPSASKEALNLSTRIRERYFAPGNEHVLELSDAAIEIDRFAEQRVSDETERCIQIVDGYEVAISGVREGIKRLIRAPDERPAPPQQKEDPPRRIGVEQLTQDPDRPVSGTKRRPSPEAIFHWFDAWLEGRLNDREKTIIREVFYCLDHPEDVTRMKDGRRSHLPSPLQASNPIRKKILDENRCEGSEHREPTAPSVDGWQPGETAPRDHGREIRIQLDCSWGVPAYWDDELQTFVLSRPLHMESIARPIRWRPIAPPTGRVERGERPNTESSPAATAAPVTWPEEWGDPRWGATPPSPPAVVDYTTPDAPPSSAEKIRECTCHPDDNPPRPCPQKHAYSECVRAAAERAAVAAFSVITEKLT